MKAWIAFEDESGFSQRPPVRATWAPRGRTPEIREPFNWKTLSGIGLVLTKPDASRQRWFLALHRGTIRSAQLVRFIRALKRHRKRRVILLWDGLPAHRSRLTQQTIQENKDWLIQERLPAYAPELNPVEPLWAHLDQTALANTPLREMTCLRQRLYQSIRQLQRHPKTGLGFLRYTELF